MEISCCWTKTAERFGLKWLKNQTLINHKTFINHSDGSRNEQRNKCVALIIEKIKQSDSGRYICKVSVEIPVLMEAEGNGTIITVTARENPADSTDHQMSKDKEKIEKVVENKRDDNSNTHTVEETPSVHLEDKDDTVRHKAKTSDIINSVAVEKETTRKWEEKSRDDPNPYTDNKGSQQDVFSFVLRCLPIIALITAFVWLYYLGTKAQKNRAAAGGNKASSKQNTEEDHEEKEEIVAEEAREEKRK